MASSKTELLEFTLEQVVDWLKYAEAKNGALLAIAGATLFGGTRTFNSLTDISALLNSYFVCFSLFVIASIILALSSFIPRLSPPFWIKFPEKKLTDNPLYFGHACKYDNQEYLELIASLTESSSSEFSKIDNALCSQIVINSKIAYIKYGMFTTAVFLFLASILTPLGALIIYIFKE